MSVEAVNQFLQKVKEDIELQKDLSQTEDNIALVEVAAKWGYEFTESELSGPIQALQALLQHRATGELSEDGFGSLSEDDLLAVVGGCNSCCGYTATSHVAE